MQVLLEGTRRDHAAEQMLALVDGPFRLREAELEAFLDPPLLARLDDVHVLGPDRAAVGRADDIEDFAQARLIRTVQRAGVEHGIHVGLGEAVKARVELGHLGTFVLMQRIEIGLPVPAEAEGIDELQHGDLLLRVDVTGVHRPDRGCLRGGRKGQHACLHLGVANLGLSAVTSVLQPIEILSPVLRNGVRIGQVGFVKRLYERRIRTEQA